MLHFHYFRITNKRNKKLEPNIKIKTEIMTQKHKFKPK